MPSLFARIASRGSFQTPPHIQYLERALLNCLKNPGPGRLLIELPVRHGKSEFLSKYVPAWYLMHRPHHRVILTGHGNEFASEFGGKARDLFAQHAGPLFGLALGDRQRADNWNIAQHQGGMVSVGTGGSISGRGANLLIGDDIVKDQQAAESPAERTRLWKWFVGDAMTRLEPQGKVILILSRRHPEDPVGQVHKLMEQGGTPWQIIRIPALAEDDDPLGRQPGEALWPQRYPVSELERIKRDLELSGESYLWDCLYMQNPIGDPSLIEWPAEYFKDILYDTLPLREEDIFCKILALDPSMGRNAKTGDYSALLYVVCDRKMHLWVEESVLLRMPSVQCEDTMVALVHKHNPHLAICEANGFQEVLVDNILLKCPQAPIEKYISTVDKEVRLRMTLTPLLASKRLHLKNSPANQLLLSQLKAFPTAQHDDGPDALSLAAIQFASAIRQVQQPRPQPVRLRV